LFLLSSCEKFALERSDVTLSGKYVVSKLDITSVDQNTNQDSLYTLGSTYVNQLLPDPFDSIRINRFYLHMDYSTIRLNELGVSPTGKDIWEGLFTLPLWEGNTDEEISKHEWAEFCAKQGWKDAKYSLELVAEEKQLLSHQKLKMRFYKVKVPALFIEEYGVAKERLEEYGYPKAIAAFLKIKKAQ
jgi:hypothetical protein